MVDAVLQLEIVAVALVGLLLGAYAMHRYLQRAGQGVRGGP